MNVDESIRRQSFGIRRLDFLAVGLIVAVCVGLAYYRATHREALRSLLRDDARGHLGAEYDAIAQAIRSGRGFADPFRAESGPTAWMPPILPYFIASLYWLTSDRRPVVVEIVIVLHALAAVSAGLVIVHAAHLLNRAVAGYTVLIVGLAANFHELFQKTFDSWLLLLTVNLLWLGFNMRWRVPRSLWVASGWGAFGGLAALCSPIVGAAWAVTTACIWCPVSFAALRGRERAVIRNVVALTAAGVVSILVVTPWTVRNRLLLGKWIPVKSNGMFEVWQSQCRDDDGVLDSSTSSLHPSNLSGEQHQLYLKVGEIVFVAEKGAIARRSIVQDPVGFLERVTNRWISSCVYYTAFRPVDEERVWAMRFQRLVFPLPFLGLIVILLVRPLPLESAISAAILLFLLVLGPYIVISYYDRYAAPLLAMKMLLVLYAWDTVGAAKRRLLHLA